jgi:hypothetical protein
VGTRAHAFVAHKQCDLQKQRDVSRIEFRLGTVANPTEKHHDLFRLADAVHEFLAPSTVLLNSRLNGQRRRMQNVLMTNKISQHPTATIPPYCGALPNRNTQQ